jgi:hypothetical protein
MSAPETEPQGSVFESAELDGVVTDEELDAMRQENLDLQRQISEANAERLAHEQQAANIATAKRLRTENTRLKLLLQQARGGQPVVDQQPQQPVVIEPTKPGEVAPDNVKVPPGGEVAPPADVPAAPEPAPAPVAEGETLEGSPAPATETPAEPPAPEAPAEPSAPSAGPAPASTEPQFTTPEPPPEPTSPTASVGEPVAPSENPTAPGAAPESSAPTSGEGA